MAGAAVLPSSRASPGTLRSGRRRLLLGVGLSVAGAAVVVAAPIALFRSSLAGGPELLAALLVVEIGAIAFLLYGLTLAEQGYRISGVPLTPSDQAEVDRRTRRSWVIWVVGLLLFLAGAYVTSTLGASLGLGLVLVGLALFLYSFVLYTQALGLERRRKTVSDSRP